MPITITDPTLDATEQRRRARERALLADPSLAADHPQQRRPQLRTLDDHLLSEALQRGFRVVDLGDWLAWEEA